MWSTYYLVSAQSGHRVNRPWTSALQLFIQNNLSTSMYLGMEEIHPNWARDRPLSHGQHLLLPKDLTPSIYDFRPQCGKFPAWRMWSKYSNFNEVQYLLEYSNPKQPPSFIFVTKPRQSDAQCVRLLVGVEDTLSSVSDGQLEDLMDTLGKESIKKKSFFARPGSQSGWLTDKIYEIPDFFT